MRALLCHCRLRLEAEDDRAMLALLKNHLVRDHLAIPPTDAQLEEIVYTRAYDYEYVEVPADEELIPEPY